MKKTNCQACGAPGIMGKTCEYCGNLVTLPVSFPEDAQSDKSSRKDPFDTDKLVIIEPDFSKKEILDNITKAYEEFIDKESGNLCHTLRNKHYYLPEEINKDSLSFGEIKRVYVPFYEESGEYQAVWIDENNRSGNFTGEYRTMGYLNNWGDGLHPSSQFAFDPDGQKNFYSSKRRIISSSAKLNGEKIKASLQIPRDIDSKVNIIATRKARNLLHDSEIKSVDAKLNAKEKQYGYILYYSIPIFINNVHVFSNLCNNQSGYFSKNPPIYESFMGNLFFTETDSLLERYFGDKEFNQYLEQSNILYIKNSVTENANNCESVEEFLKKCNNKYVFGKELNNLKNKIGENEYNIWFDSVLQQLKAQKPMKLTVVDKIIKWLKS